MAESGRGVFGGCGRGGRRETEGPGQGGGGGVQVRARVFFGGGGGFCCWGLGVCGWAMVAGLSPQPFRPADLTLLTPCPCALRAHTPTHLQGAEAAGAAARAAGPPDGPHARGACKSSRRPPTPRIVWGLAGCVHYHLPATPNTHTHTYKHIPTHSTNTHFNPPSSPPKKYTRPRPSRGTGTR